LAGRKHSSSINFEPDGQFKIFKILKRAIKLKTFFNKNL